MGDNPIELLDLISLYEKIKPETDYPYWWKITEADLWDEVFSQSFPDVNEFNRKKFNP
ncbi:hypothetical protein V8J88_23895 [Massilia sp. W12]|uniref:hypothetical protein n=1 Tax=Massilia sp. W12 TaxID=3126507 RepID=UPI0030D3F84A